MYLSTFKQPLNDLLNWIVVLQLDIQEIQETQALSITVQFIGKRLKWPKNLARNLNCGFCKTIVHQNSKIETSLSIHF